MRRYRESFVLILCLTLTLFWCGAAWCVGPAGKRNQGVSQERAEELMHQLLLQAEQGPEALTAPELELPATPAAQDKPRKDAEENDAPPQPVLSKDVQYGEILIHEE